MNSLKLIEKEIKRRKASIRKLEEQPPQVRKYFLIAEKKYELQTLQQIKTELEAWEVVKEEIEYNEEKACSERPDIVYSFKHWTFEINEEQDNFEEKSIKLKKAVEV